MTNPFNKPSESAGPGLKVTDFEGALCIFTYRESKTGVKTRFDKPGEDGKPVVIVNIDCVEGVPEGTLSKMPPQGFGKQPTKLSDHTGEFAPEVMIFQGYLRGSFRGRNAGDLVLGRITVAGMVTNQSVNDQDLKASWVLEDANEADTAKAVEFLNKKQASKFAQPAAVTSSVVTADLPNEPNF